MSRPSQPQTVTNQIREAVYRTCSRFSTSADFLNTVFGKIFSAYTQDGRHYHNLVHISDCLTMLRHYFEDTVKPDLYSKLELALLFHDIIYDTVPRPDGVSNEVASAKELINTITGLRIGNLSGKQIGYLDEVTDYIMATEHGKRTPSSEGDELIIDIDLAILGAPSLEFDLFETQIRAEYAKTVPSVVFFAFRIDILEQLKTAAQGNVYYNEVVHNDRGEFAIQNIERTVAEYKSKFEHNGLDPKSVVELVQEHGHQEAFLQGLLLQDTPGQFAELRNYL